MAVYKADILDVELNTGNIARSFLCHNIGKDDQKADRFGVRCFRDGEPVSLSGVSIQGFMLRPNGSHFHIHGSANTGVSGNEAWVDLPQEAYDYEGKFCLALKLIGGEVTGTIRIIDGMVNNTFVDGAVAPTAAVPTYQEILSVYDQMVAAKAGSVRFDTDQTLTAAQKTQARGNIEAASESDVADLKSALTAVDPMLYPGQEIELLPSRCTIVKGAWENRQRVSPNSTKRVCISVPVHVQKGSVLHIGTIPEGQQYLYGIYCADDISASGNSGWISDSDTDFELGYTGELIIQFKKSNDGTITPADITTVISISNYDYGNENEIANLEDDILSLGTQVSVVESQLSSRSMEDAEVYQVKTGSYIESESGTRLRILFEVQTGDSFSCISEYGSGVNVRLYSEKRDAVYSGDGYLQEFNSGYTTEEVKGKCNYDGWLVISEKKTSGTAISAAEKQEMIDATTAVVNGRYYQLYEESLTPVADDSTTALNRDMDTALVGMSRFNTKKTGGSVSAVGYKKNLSFAVITDIHSLTGIELTRFFEYVNAKKKYFDFALCLGDIAAKTPGDDVSWYSSIVADSQIPFYFTVGNHDTAYQNEASLSQSDARSRYYAKIEQNGWLVSTDFKGAGECSWMKDFSDYNIRIISLFEYGNSETMATGSPDSYQKRWMDSSLLQWFADKLYSTPQGYSVIVLLHQVPYDEVTYIDDKFTATHDFRAEPPHFYNTIDGNPIEEIVNAFMTSTRISKTYNSIASYSLGKTASVTKDFSSRSENGNFICYLCGHAHTAYVLSSQNFPSQKTIVVNAGSENIHQRSYGDVNFDPDSRNKDSFYCFGFDTDRRKINIVQIGGQITDDLRKRDFTSVSY